MGKTVDGPYVMVLQPLPDGRARLEGIIGDVVHLRFASTEAELTNLATEVFPDVARLVIICLKEDAGFIADLDAVTLARMIFETTKLPVILTRGSFPRSYSSNGIIYCVPTANLFEACGTLLGA